MQVSYVIKRLYGDIVPSRLHYFWLGCLGKHIHGNIVLENVSMRLHNPRVFYSFSFYLERQTQNRLNFKNPLIFETAFI